MNLLQNFAACFLPGISASVTPSSIGTSTIGDSNPPRPERLRILRTNAQRTLEPPEKPTSKTAGAAHFRKWLAKNDVMNSDSIEVIQTSVLARHHDP